MTLLAFLLYKLFAIGRFEHIQIFPVMLAVNVFRDSFHKVTILSHFDGFTACQKSLRPSDPSAGRIVN
jgi:hypothetical protein